MGNICQAETEQEKSLSIKKEEIVVKVDDDANDNKKTVKNFSSGLDLEDPIIQPQLQKKQAQVQQPLTNETKSKVEVVEKKKIKKKKRLKKRKRDINDYVDAFSVKDTEQIKKNRAARRIQNMFKEWKKRKEEAKNKGWFS